MKKIIYGLILSVILFSCESDGVDTNDIVGKWKLQNANIALKVKDEKAETMAFDFSPYNYIIKINQDGTFEAEVDSLSKALLEENSDFSIAINSDLKGTYTYSNGVLTFKYNDPDYEANVVNKYKFGFEGTDTFVISQDRGLYLEMLKQQLDSQAGVLAFFGITVDELMKELEADLESLDVKVKYSRVK